MQKGSGLAGLLISDSRVGALRPRLRPLVQSGQQTQHLSFVHLDIDRNSSFSLLHSLFPVGHSFMGSAQILCGNRLTFVADNMNRDDASSLHEEPKDACTRVRDSLLSATTAPPFALAAGQPANRRSSSAPTPLNIAESDSGV